MLNWDLWPHPEEFSSAEGPESHVGLEFLDDVPWGGFGPGTRRVTSACQKTHAQSQRGRGERVGRRVGGAGESGGGKMQTTVFEQQLKND